MIAGKSNPSPPPAGALLDSTSKLGHACTADDPFVRQMIESFRQVTPADAGEPAGCVSTIDLAGVAPLARVIAVGGSFSSVPNALAPHKVLGYVKIATARLDLSTLAALKAPVVNPDAMRKLLTADADTRGAVLPMGNVCVPGQTLFQSVRHALHATFDRFCDGAIFDTLEFLVSHAWEENPEAWRVDSRQRPRFFCPFCDGLVTFPRPPVGHRRQFRCAGCRAELTLVDYLGLVSDASDSTGDSAVALNLKGVLEHLLLLTFLRKGVSTGGAAGGTLLLKDGPLMLRGQSARLVDAIRAYLRHLADRGAPAFLCGIEQEGAFATHRAAIEPWFGMAGAGGGDVRLFVPDNRYILERVKHAGGASAVYGRKGMYASKAFCRLDPTNLLVLSLPNRRHGLDAYAADPVADDLLGRDRVLATLRELVSRQFPGVPLPLLAVNRLCELPYYPSNNLLDG